LLKSVEFPEELLEELLEALQLVTFWKQISLLTHDKEVSLGQSNGNEVLLTMTREVSLQPKVKLSRQTR
jgi:hypothetical protein